MGGSLNADTLVRNFISIFIECLDFKGASVMLYDNNTDLVSVKDLIGISPELFAKFKFYSDNRILAMIFSEEGYWKPSEQDANLMVAEFDTDEVRNIKMIFPMRIKDHLVGLLLLTDRNIQHSIETNYLMIQAIAGLASTSINNAILFESSVATKLELDRKVFNLMILQQSGKVLSSTLDLDELIKLSIDMFLETVWVSKGILMLFSDERPELEVRAFKGMTEEEVEGLKTNSAEIWAMMTIEKERKPIFAQAPPGKTSYQIYSVANRELPFAVYIPMLKEGELYGIVKVGHKINDEPFNENDLEFFATIASQAVISFENARLYSLAITDSITRLYVHRYFQMRLKEEVDRSRRYNSTISLLMCDIDHFKSVNDNYGHQQGDLVLREVSKIMRKNVRNTDIAARYGGEEFAIILPETTQADAKVVAERIRHDIAHCDFPSLITGQAPLKCTISIGVAGFPLNSDDKEQLIQKADIALYKAKRSGRNKVVLCGME